MRIERRYTETGSDPYAGIAFCERTSRIVNPDGSVVFEATLQAPEGWSQVAVDILAQKYCRKAGVATDLRPIDEVGVPDWLRRSEPAEDSFVLNDTMLVTARGSIGWRHAFADQAQAVNSFVGGGPMTIASAPLAGDVAVVTVGASTDISEDVSLDIAYEGSIGSGSFSSAVKVTLSGRF